MFCLICCIIVVFSGPVQQFDQGSWLLCFSFVCACVLVCLGLIAFLLDVKA